MSDRAAGRLAWSLSFFYLVCAGVGGLLAGPNGDFGGSIGFLLGVSGFAVVGGLLASRRPRNPISWLVLVAPIAAGIGFLASELSVYGLVTVPGSIPFAAFAGWLSLWAWMGMLTPLVFVVFLFPSGHLPSRAWRPAAWSVGIFCVIATLVFAFGSPGAEGHPEISNPYLVSWLTPVYGPLNDAFVLYIGVFAIAVASLIVRYRAASAIEKQQLKWIVAAAVLMVVCFIISTVASSPISDLGWLFALLALPVAIAIAILRYRLYDIDTLINRAIVYAAVSAILAVTFFAGLVLLQPLLRPLTGASELGIAVSTLVSFALFQPVRRRIQSAVDRRFDRHKYDAERTLDAFSASLRDEIDLDALSGDLVSAVGSTMAPAHVSVWLRSGELAPRPDPAVADLMRRFRVS